MAKTEKVCQSKLWLSHVKRLLLVTSVLERGLEAEDLVALPAQRTKSGDRGAAAKGRRAPDALQSDIRCRGCRRV